MSKRQVDSRRSVSVPLSTLLYYSAESGGATLPPPHSVTARQFVPQSLLRAVCVYRLVAPALVGACLDWVGCAAHPTMSSIFEEIVPAPARSSTKYVDAFAVAVAPHQCGPLVQRLSGLLPLGGDVVDLSHLKRVRRRRSPPPAAVVETPVNNVHDDDDADAEVNDNSDVDGRKKRRRNDSESGELRLEVLLGSVELMLRCELVVQANSIDLSQYGLTEVSSVLLIVQIPARQADSQEEWNEFNAVWPASYYPNQTKQYRQQMLALGADEIQQMVHGMEEAIRDAEWSSTGSDRHTEIGPFVGAVVVSPETGNVVATAAQERVRQLGQGTLQGKASTAVNPLATSVLYAIQGVSRLERDAAVLAGGMQTERFQRGQYLCTGYDVYTTREPTVYEAMALVHSRIRRLVFAAAGGKSVDGGGLTRYSVHALPGTNHRYRVFALDRDSDLAKRCCSMYKP
jgi:tRNA(Arg) A34 adenosine deaminase TadA